MNKFKVNDVVRFKADSSAASNYPQEFKIIRVYESHDKSFKYDIQTNNGLVMIIANLESILELK